MIKYITQRGHVFTVKPGFQFDIDHKAREYQIRGQWAAVVFGSRKSFDIALEKDLLESYVTEIYTQFWN